MSCDFELEGFCNLDESIKKEGRCEFESTKKDEMIAGITGLCLAKESDLIEICPDCDEDIIKCPCNIPFILVIKEK